jgi:hypothetical protein
VSTILPAMLARDAIVEEKIALLAQEGLEAPDMASRLASIIRAINGLNYRFGGYRRLVQTLSGASTGARCVVSQHESSERGDAGERDEAAARDGANFLRRRDRDWVPGLIERLRRLEESLCAMQRLQAVDLVNSEDRLPDKPAGADSKDGDAEAVIEKDVQSLPIAGVSSNQPTV